MQNTAVSLDTFAQTVVTWQKLHGRHDLPWQNTQDPYRIWLSEIMLQQTQVGTVIGYYERFLDRFPTLQDLAHASQEDVMPYWAGLGYYARARNLHRCAQVICEQHNGRFPPTAEEIMQLPGIGRSTAAAIAAFSTGQRSPIMDGNVKRVFTRCFGIYGETSSGPVDKILWKTAEEIVAQAPPSLDMAAYTQGLMDLGASCCSRSKPQCQRCPLVDRCFSHLNQQQQALPTPKRRARIPERECKMLILQNKNRVLLEQRPSPGIWGGLWCLPQFDTLDALRDYCAQRGQRVVARQKMAGLAHTFTHFKLHIEPWHIQCDLPGDATPRGDQQWFETAMLQDVALPAPVRKLLDGLYSPLELSAAPADNG